MIYPEQVGIRIAEGRRRQGLTQNRVAARMGVTPQAVSKWERGLSCPDLVLLDELAELLDTSIDRLLTGRDGCRSIERPQEVFLPAVIHSRQTAPVVGIPAAGAVLCNPAVFLSDNPDCVCCTFCRIGAYAVHEEVLHMGVSRTRGSRSPGGQGMFVQYPGTCTAIFGSMTQTLHAQSSLAAASIRTAVTKISSAQTHGGCAYGLTFPCMQAGNVRQILADAGIRVRQIFGEP